MLPSLLFEDLLNKVAPASLVPDGQIQQNRLKPRDQWCPASRSFLFIEAGEFPFLEEAPQQYTRLDSAAESVILRPLLQRAWA